MGEWIDIDKLIVPGLDRVPSHFAKRFYSCEIRELIDVESWFVHEWFSDCKTWLDVVKKVITEIKYPLDWAGRPTDFHYLQAFRKYPAKCMRTYRVERDFWQKASETAFMGLGDCEDSSILCGAGLYLKGYKFWIEVGVVYVKINATYKALGGHAWVISENDSRKWVLVETTLDKVPKRFPEVNPDAFRHYVGKLMYEAVIRFNKYNIQVALIKPPTPPHEQGVIGSIVLEFITQVKEKTRKMEKKKLKVIREAWREAGLV